MVIFQISSFALANIQMYSVNGEDMQMMVEAAA